MNIIRMTGGLGNQMFQYALYLNFINRDVNCKFENWTEYEGKSNARPILLKDAFNIDYPIASLEEYNKFTDSYMDLIHRILRKFRGRKSSIYEEATADFDAIILDKNNAYLTGYFQSEKYFKDIESIVRKSFTFTDEVINESSKLLKGIPLNNTVSLHIRRGDYLDVDEAYGNICTDEYYQTAISYMCNKVDNPTFIIFSNDVPWVKEWCSIIADTVSFNYQIIDNTTEATGYLDMCLMSCCTHNIIANSSFSWWGAYLNQNPDKIVVAPSKWNNITNQKDIYSSWMTVL